MSQAAPTERSAARSTFGPVMAAGLLGAGAAAVGATRRWVDFGGDQAAAVAAVAQVPDRAPLPAALSLVVLAGFGAVLVTRGAVRRALLAAVLVMAASLAVSVVVTAPQVLADARSAYAGLGRNAEALGPSWWPWLAGLGALVAGVAAGAGWREAPQWPEMGRRYDAPVAPTSVPAPTTTEEWWRAIDAGTDPTEAAS